MIHQFNFITLLFLILIFMPLVIGFIKGIHTESIVALLVSLIELMEILILIFVSFAMVREIFVDEKSFGFKITNLIIPPSLKEILLERSLLVYAIVTPILLLIFVILSSMYLKPIYTSFLKSLQNYLGDAFNKTPLLARRFLGFVWSIPKVFVLVTLFAFVIHFVGYFAPSLEVSNMALQSKIYNDLNRVIVSRALESNLSKDIPLIASNVFAVEKDVGSYENKLEPNKKGKIIEYFNGVTLEEAVTSNEEIDNFAKGLLEGKVTTKEQAYAIYSWISQNIKYDHDKALHIVRDASLYSSGAKEAFYNQEGICFDHASLFIAMARANGIQVAMVTGLGYNGSFWGDHAWNQFYSKEEERWVNVDPTFGILGDYFDNSNFGADHRYEKVRQVWYSRS
jgi:hypothetical protein